MRNDVYSLFPYPLLVCTEGYVFDDAEKQHLAGQEMIENIGNSMSKNEKLLDDEELSALRLFVDQQVHSFKKNLLHIKDENEIYITQSWLNKSESGEFHQKHKHPNSVISGVIFLDENDDDSLPAIRFHRTLDMFPVEFQFDDMHEFNANCREFYPTQGMLMLFPSLLEHDVGINESGRVRSSISFNTYVRGTVGEKGRLTELVIS